MTEILGIHHVTAIASDPQRNLDFYAGVLGLRLVKRTVNYDDPGTYHLYYGDELGTPGSIMTFFPWPRAHPGQHGVGQVAVTSFSVLPGAIAFWLERLVRYGVEHSTPVKRGPAGDEERAISFRDHDGTMLEIVGHAGAEARQPWSGAPGISPDHAIRGFHGVTLWVDAVEPTERVLTETLGFRALRDDATTKRYVVGSGGPGALVDVRGVGGFLGGTSGAGTVHHVAWQVESDAIELAVRERVIAAAMQPTPVFDRTYFHSVYFREPGGVLFELATSAPGFTIDEDAEHLGERLTLPSHLEPRRAAIEGALPAIHSLRIGDEPDARRSP
jgi:glyoxalase family protein